MATPDRLDPLAPVVTGGVTFLVDRARPVAVLRDAAGAVQVVTWPDAPLPAASASASVVAAPGCVWVIYTDHDADGSGPDRHTAVRVGADGQVAACELGALTPIGVDEVGLWVCPDPYLAMSDGPAGSDGDLDDDGDDESPAGPPQGLEHAPVESWEDFHRAERQVDEIEVAADAQRFLATAPADSAEGDSSGWFAFAPGGEPEPATSLPEPPAPQLTGPVTLSRVRADGPVEEMVVSRVASRVEAIDDGVLRVVFHPTGPVRTPDGYGGYGVHYPQRTAVIDLSGGLPADVDLDALASRPVEEHQDEDDEETVVDEGDRVDLTGVAGTRWTPRSLDAEEVEAAVQAVREQYARLDEPDLVWTARDDRWHRVQSRYADVAVRVEGVWPDTEVVVDFSLRPDRGRLFRRRTRVFDDAGLPSISPYPGVYLDEDLATTDLDQLPVREGRTHI